MVFGQIVARHSQCRVRLFRTIETFYNVSSAELLQSCGTKELDIGMVELPSDQSPF